MKAYVAVGVDIQMGKQRDAWAWAIKLADYCNKNQPQTLIEVIQNATGPGNRIVWVSKHDSAGDEEKYREWYEGDEGFQKIIDEANEQELIDWSSLDRIYYRIRG